jgi:UDP-glucose 4-epimerase
LDYLIKNKTSSLFNLGNGNGYSVKEVTEVSKKISKQNFNVEICPRRAGDPAYIVADTSLAKKELLWKPRYDSLEDIIRHSWEWEQNTSWH